MLGGLDPVIIFQFSALSGKKPADFIGPQEQTVVERIPIVSQIPTLIDQPPIPVYLSEQLFNIAIGAVSKSVDLQTATEGLSNGLGIDVNQNPIQSSVEITIEGKQNSIALILLSSLIDIVYEKAMSKEYAISFIYGPTTIFRALLQSYSIDTVEGTDKISIKIKLSKGAKNPSKDLAVPSVSASTGSIPVGAT